MLSSSLFNVWIQAQPSSLHQHSQMWAIRVLALHTCLKDQDATPVSLKAPRILVQAAAHMHHLCCPAARPASPGASHCCCKQQLTATMTGRSLPGSGGDHLRCRVVECSNNQLVNKQLHAACWPAARHAPQHCIAHQEADVDSHMVAGRLLPSSEGDSHAKAQRLATANSAALKRHFCALTCALLAVLEPLCTPLGSSGPAAETGLQAFSMVEAVARLERLSFPPFLQERFPSKVWPCAGWSVPHDLEVSGKAIQGK